MTASAVLEAAAIATHASHASPSASPMPGSFLAGQSVR